MKEPIDLQNTLWATSVLANNKCLAIIIFTGQETRMQMNNQKQRSKFGKIDQEINYITKVLFIYLIIIAFLMVLFKG